MTKRNNTGVSMAGAQPAGAEAWLSPTMLWCSQLADLATVCAGSFSEDEAHQVRKLRTLLARAPEPDLIRGLVLPPVERFDRLLAIEACGAAVLEMLAAPAGYLVSRGASGIHAASVYLPDAGEEVTAIGDSLALALAGALAQALVNRMADREPATVQPG